MTKALYSADYMVVYDGAITKYGVIEGLLEMGEIDHEDIRPATYAEICRYLEVQKRES
jgi:hypothetical protein